MLGGNDTDTHHTRNHTTYTTPLLMHYSDALDEITTAITRAAGKQLYDWVDGPGDHHDGLAHIDAEDRDSRLFTITISVSTDIMSEREVEALHARMNAVADRYGIATDLREANNSHCVYEFNLHARFIQHKPAFA